MAADLYPGIVFALWIGWIAYWYLAAFGAKPSIRRESLASRASHMGPLWLGIYLLIAARHPFTPWLGTRWLPASLATYWVGVAILVAGLSFSVWARQHLGRNWSGTVTLKEGHELICTGPYRWVRHPIYTGLLTGLLGTAVLDRNLEGLVGFGVCAAALVRKLRIEERWMRERFGARYSDYAARTQALVPLVF